MDRDRFDQGIASRPAPATKEDLVIDPTEDLRRQLAVVINAVPRSRELLEAVFGQVWDSAQLRQDFEVVGFRAPFVVVRRHGDSRLASLLFQHEPRFYFSFVPD
jgi:hypothetical protein